MSGATRIRNGGVVLLLSCLAVPASALEMFCPRANLVLSAQTPESGGSRDDIVMLASAAAPTAFPRALTDIVSPPPDVNVARMKLVDCSTREFNCKLVTFDNAEGKQQEFLLVLPREIHPGVEYNFRGVRMLARLSRYSSPRNVAAAQVTLWQRIGDFEMPMELTVQQSRGILYWDGLNFTPGNGGPGELCVLTSESGLFRSTGVKLH
jgi:hypothetical protein